MGVSITFTASGGWAHRGDVAVNANGRWASIVVTAGQGDVLLLSKSCFDSCDWGMFPWAPRWGNTS